jgi:hypothetical protein
MEPAFYHFQRIRHLDLMTVTLLEIVLETQLVRRQEMTRAMPFEVELVRIVQLLESLHIQSTSCKKQKNQSRNRMHYPSSSFCISRANFQTHRSFH